MTYFAYVTSAPLRSRQAVDAMSRHAVREDHTGPRRQRDGATHTANVQWPSLGPRPDYYEAWEAHVAKTGAQVRRNAPLALHSLVGVSRGWIEEEGDPYDPKNPRNIKLLRSAVVWGNRWSNGGVIAARLDLDEVGAGVVDLFTAPIVLQGRRNGRRVPTVSVNGALEALSIELCGRKGSHYAALNTSWAAYAAKHLDPRLLRGEPKAQTGRVKLTPDQYREQLRLEEQAAQIARIAAKLEEREAQLRVWEKRLRERERLAGAEELPAPRPGWA